MATYSDEGVVLRTIRLGEADRIVTFATPEHGKVRAVAKGIRKTKSRLAGRLEPLTHVKMMCWRGRELDVVNQVEAIEHFKAIRGDLDRVPVALTMLEVVDHIALERQPMEQLFRMLVGALRTLEERTSPALLGAFLWKLLALEGVGPSLECCAGCGNEVELVAFDAGEGGFLCRSCRRGQAVGARNGAPHSPGPHRWSPPGARDAAEPDHCRSRAPSHARHGVPPGPKGALSPSGSRDHNGRVAGRPSG